MQSTKFIFVVDRLSHLIHHQNQEDMSTVEVHLIAKSSDKLVLQSDKFTLKNGKLPLKEIMQKWKIKDLEWVDVSRHIAFSIFMIG